MILGELRESDESDWDAYVDSQPRANCYHLRAWKRAAESAYGIEAPFLLARASPGGSVRGVLPLFVIRGAPAGAYLTTGLFGAYGPVLADAEAGEALIAEALRRARAANARFLSVKAVGAEPHARGFDPVDRWVVARLPLPDAPEVLWREFRDKTRNAIRKGQRSGLAWREGDSELGGFYDVLAENMHRKGSPIYGRTFLAELVRELGERASIVTLADRGRAVSGALVIRYGGVATVPFASSRHSSLHLNPNNLLYWEIISRACRAGLHTLDFGRSLRGSGALAFKLGWGARTEPQPMYVQSIRGAPPRFDTGSCGVRMLVRLWRSLPRPFADALGPQVCRRWLA